ncbi:MAG: hypothetical protein EA353_14355 [Puniceicoccaceae bacterium]|nr:MAG: hypothetical protein EA353_14355 [Puniceicoccaceae bacterium]
MDKQRVFDLLIAEVKRELEGARAASLDAADYATNEESRADSQWDTQGLEASYLAAGQAGQARHWAAVLDDLVGYRSTILAAYSVVQNGALVRCELDGQVEAFFLLPSGGGVELSVDDTLVTVISLKSPFAAALRGRSAGDVFKLPSGLSGTVLSVS